MVNEKGEIIDKTGKVIGTVLDVKDHEKLVGDAVTEKGDVISDQGESQANVHIDDNYTPTQVPAQAPEKRRAGGWNVLGKAKSAMQYGDSIRNAVSYGQNLQGAYNKFTQGQKAEADKTGEHVKGVEGPRSLLAAKTRYPRPFKWRIRTSLPRRTSVPAAGTEGLKSQEQKEGEAETSAAGDKGAAEPALGETGKEAGEQGGSLAVQSPRPISEQDTGGIPESSKETVEEAAPEGQKAPEEVEGVAGGDKLDQDKAADLSVERASLAGTTTWIKRSWKKPSLLGGETKPGEDTLGEGKDEVTGKAEEGQLGKDKLGEDKLEEETKPGEETIAEDKGQLSEDKLGEDTVGEAQDEAAGKVEEGQLGEDKLGEDKLDETEPSKEALDEGRVEEGQLGENELAETETSKETLGEGKDEVTDKVEEGAEEAGETAEKPLDFTVLKGTKVNKVGNLVNDKGDIIGRLVDGDPKQLIGRAADEEGQIWNDSGKVIGKAEPIADADRDEAAKEFAPFENFPDAVVEGDGRVMSEGRQVGEVIEGDPKRMKGSRVDEDGDILDRRGNVIGRAKPWDEPEEVPPEVIDMSSLAGKRVNKAGNVVDAHGQIFGRVVEGNVKALVGRMCDKEGNIMSESGDKIGRAELVPESEREGSREGPFAELSGCTVARDGTVVTPSGEVVGRLTSGDGKVLYGRPVDEDGDVVDKNGNVLGKAERWEEPEKKKDPLAGRRVNREGNVVDEDGNIIGKLTSGDLNICSGKEIDDDGDVVNSKGMTIGHVSLLEDIPPEPEESAEDREKREQAEKDRKLAGLIAASIEQSLEKIRPILRMITDKVDRAERTPKEELDEEQLVREVRPLIEEGSKILTETNGAIRGLDPDGRIQRQAKHKASTKEATPEEHHLAEVLKELTGDVTQTIDNAKRKIEGMPHAKKELNPLWGLLSEPLFQIIAAVGLLLNGVLSLVGRLLGGLGLGGLVDNLLGTLGLNRVLEGLGLGSVTSALTGKKDKK
ncbi:hypothetical protein J3459_006574 [Metarhizium acridum]|nr:hypothetical protein J3459_006574 [Metarhizium acridum]